MCLTVNMLLPGFVMKILFLADSHVLQKVEILCGDFEETAIYASSNSLFYFDPPYKPLSKTSSFNSYAKEEFDDNEQIRLRDFCCKIAEHKANFILSNSDVKGKDEDEAFLMKYIMPTIFGV